jgi:uncharacterized protein (TIGR02598 family)
MTRRPIKAFSLVEVVLAIGILGFAVLATIGLLSVGHDTNKRARDEGFAAQIAANEFERIRSLSAASFPATAGSLPSRYFDSEMKEISSNARALYELRVDFSVAPNGTADWVVNAEVRNLPQAANPTINRFTILVRSPDS